MSVESSLRVRVDPPLHQEFLEACRRNDLTASQVIRAFMRNYVEDAIADIQADMFAQNFPQREAHDAAQRVKE